MGSFNCRRSKSCQNRKIWGILTDIQDAPHQDHENVVQEVESKERHRWSIHLLYKVLVYTEDAQALTLDIKNTSRDIWFPFSSSSATVVKFE
jgi:hypothetical protein